MKKIKKVSAALSIATSVLLQACSSSESTSPATTETNTKAPALIASWASDCTITSSGSSTNTSASGGGGSVTGGTAFITNATFNADGSATLTKENFASTDCNPNATISFSRFDTNYFIGDAGTANDGSSVTNIRYGTSSVTYSIFQIQDSTSLYLGDFATSTAGNDGSSESKRWDGLGVELNK